MAQLLFDLDGTISDPFTGISRSINYALESRGYPQQAGASLAQYIGPPLDVSFKLITGVNDDAEIAALVAKYRERYAEVGYSENTLYPGIVEALQMLRTQNIPMGICTSKRADFADKILNLFGISDYFDFISGGDIGIHKWQQIESLLASQSISRQTLMIGDRAVDLQAAHINGLNACGVLWGYGSLGELEAESPSCILTKTKELGLLIRHDMIVQPSF
ncbi:HAD-IA family hydrolase [Iodobacter fluviatilis]|uniref:5'-nucleotidase n=1 Tax=Iodobacter fluviatilis TaxID=537 RepID=A0A377Q8J2_9NEIS|nr:HAD-IA family hydrolase [Iodobacter fluviatilis]TCU88781.1 phosphoglycolate phosphatase [Iodobacter fluviatilis]STQ91147.1 5'-nucleotidase [Iodobacter fluviatilis]